jgi:methionyl-tRNA synthetase
MVTDLTSGVARPGKGRHPEGLRAGVEETRKQSPRAIVIDSLNAAIRELDTLKETRHTRELRARAQNYVRATKGWEAVRPTDAQLAAMLACVVELHASIEVARRGGPPPTTER